MEGLLQTLVIGGLFCLALLIALYAPARRREKPEAEKQKTGSDDTGKVLEEIATLRLLWQKGRDLDRMFFAREIALRLARLYFLKFGLELERESKDPLVPADDVLWRQAQVWANLAGLRRKHTAYGTGYAAKMSWLVASLHELDTAMLEKATKEAKRLSKLEEAERMGASALFTADDSSDDLSVVLGQTFVIRFTRQEVLDAGSFFIYLRTMTADGEDLACPFELTPLMAEEENRANPIGFLVTLEDRRDDGADRDEIVLTNSTVRGHEEDARRFQSYDEVVLADAHPGNLKLRSGRARATLSIVNVAYDEDGRFTEFTVKGVVREKKSKEKTLSPAKVIAN